MDPRRVHETLGSWFLSTVLYQAQPSLVRRVMGLQDPTLRVLSSPSLTAPQSCGHWGQLCLVISPGVPAWLPAGGHSPAGVTRDLPLGLPVQLQPRPQPACGFLEGCRDGTGGDKEGAGGSCTCCSRDLPAKGDQGSPCPYPRPLPQPPWTISSHNAGRATRWPCGCGWTTPRTTSTRGEWGWAGQGGGPVLGAGLCWGLVSAGLHGRRQDTAPPRWRKLPHR